MTTKSQLIQPLCLLLLLSARVPTASGEDTALNSLAQTTNRRHPSVVMVLAFNKKTGAHQQATGFFLNQAGDIVTNYHVIAEASDIKIWTAANLGFPATKIISTDVPADLAIMAVDIPGNNVQPATLARQLPASNETIRVIGYPLGHQQTRSEGVIASLLPTPEVGTLLQFTAPIAVGSSGSPLFNDSGQVVGVASFILYFGADKTPRYFAIPATRLIKLQEQSGLISAIPAYRK